MFTTYYLKLFTDKEKYFLFHFIKFVTIKYMNTLNELNQTKIFNNLYVKVDNELIIFPKIFKFNDARRNRWYSIILPEFNPFYEKSSNCIHNTLIWDNSMPFYYVFYNNISDFTLMYNHVKDVIKILIDNFIVPVGSIWVTPPTLQSKTNLINGPIAISWNTFELIYIKPFEVEEWLLILIVIWVKEI